MPYNRLFLNRWADEETLRQAFSESLGLAINEIVVIHHHESHQINWQHHPVALRCEYGAALGDAVMQLSLQVADEATGFNDLATLGALAEAIGCDVLVDDDNTANTMLVIRDRTESRSIAIDADARAADPPEITLRIDDDS